MKREPRSLTHAEWLKEAVRLFGATSQGWRFVCPACSHVASVADWEAAGAPEGAVAFSCVGRYTGDPRAAADNAFKRKGGPCNYTGGGLFALNPVTVLFDDGKSGSFFEFADGATQP